MATPGSPLISIESGDLRLEAEVPESIMPHVALGDRVPVRLDALGREFEGWVVEIVPEGDPGSHSFIVKLSLGGSQTEIQNPKSEIRSGMFGRASFITGHERSIEVPREATWEREGLHYVFALNSSDIARIRIVTLGSPHGGLITVLSGLSPGDRIVASGLDMVSDGEKVTPK